MPKPDPLVVRLSCCRARSPVEPSVRHRHSPGIGAAVVPEEAARPDGLRPPRPEAPPPQDGRRVRGRASIACAPQSRAAAGGSERRDAFSIRAILERVTDPLATEETHIDRWLCAVRLVKTRPLATRLCEAGHVLVKGSPAKPSTKVRAGERVEAFIADRERVVEVVRPIESRVEPSSPRPVTWTTARRSCRRPGQ